MLGLILKSLKSEHQEGINRLRRFIEDNGDKIETELLYDLESILYMIDEDTNSIEETSEIHESNADYFEKEINETRTELKSSIENLKTYEELKEEVERIIF